MPRLRKKTSTNRAPSQQPAKKSHNHSGFIAAIIIAMVLFLAAGAVAYMSWSNESTLSDKVSNLMQQNEMLVEENAMLADESEENAVTRFYFAQIQGDTYQIRSLDSNGVDELVYTSQTPHEILKVYAQPRVGFDGKIFIQRLSEGDDPGLNLQTLDTATGQIGIAQLNKDLPGARATILSPDERMIAAVYDNPEFGLDTLELKVWSLLDDSSETLVTLADNESFVSAYDGLGGSYGQKITWTSLSCVEVLIYKKSIYGENVVNEYREFCM
ncbi:hypothetical protein HQ524_00570 [Candidatus Uhrbacteria bacterium]|nr:hypothetical protein [Candidatus Uhrbacteria bacterium]